MSRSASANLAAAGSATHRPQADCAGQHADSRCSEPQQLFGDENVEDEFRSPNRIHDEDQTHHDTQARICPHRSPTLTELIEPACPMALQRLGRRNTWLREARNEQEDERGERKADTVDCERSGR